MNYLKYLGLAVLLAAIAWVGYTYPNVPFGASSAGSTFGTAKFAAISVSLASPGANATSSSILNSDANDRYVSSIKAGCQNVGTSLTAYTGTGLAALTLKVSTTSTAAPAAVGTNQVGGGSITIATSTVQFAISTSTIGASVGSSNNYAVWPAGSYMTFQTNATNTAACVFGVDYFAS